MAILLQSQLDLLLLIEGWKHHFLHEGKKLQHGSSDIYRELLFPDNPMVMIVEFMNVTCRLACSGVSVLLFRVKQIGCCWREHVNISLV